FPEWSAHVVAYVEDRTRHLSTEARNALLERLKSMYVIMTEQRIMDYLNFSTALEQQIEATSR
ncbi:MAG: hypothetical protein AAFN74_27540, partial [Myxococcota bacterium]